MWLVSEYVYAYVYSMTQALLSASLEVFDSMVHLWPQKWMDGLGNEWLECSSMEDFSEVITSKVITSKLNPNLTTPKSNLDPETITL